MTVVKTTSKSMKKPIWLRTDELAEAMDSLRKVSAWLIDAISDPMGWKWCLIAVHNSLQGFMVCGLRGSNGLNVLKPHIREEWLTAYHSGTGKYPREELDTFLNLYKKIKGREMDQFTHSKRFVPAGQQGKSIKQLNSSRNAFIHYLPIKRSIEVSGLPKIIQDCVAIIEFLVFESGNIPINPDERTEIRKQISEIHSTLAKVEVK